MRLKKQRRRSCRAWRAALLLALCTAAVFAGGCRKRKPAEEQKVSAVTVLGNPEGQRADPSAPIVARVPGGEYDIWPSGYVQSYRMDPRTRRRSSIEDREIDTSAWGDKLWVDGKEVTDFVYDFKSLRTTDTKSKIGVLGKHAEVKARSKSRQIEKTLSLEVYDDFPNMAVEQLTYFNLGTTGLQIDRVQMQRHRLDASNTDMKAQGNDFWSFHGASIEAGRDAVIPIPHDFSQRNLMGGPVAVKGELASVGGGIPVVALWTATLGIAIGHVEPLPQSVAFPVHTLPNGDVEIYMEIEPAVHLKAQEDYSTPRSFVATYAGDYYEPLRLYAQVLQRVGDAPAKTSDAAYGATWSVRADESGTTPAQMIATIPELKAMNLRWATLDGRWFDAYGDWEPRGENFSGGAIEKMVAEFHKQGILASLAWTPLAVEDGEAGRKNSGSRVAKEHPEWLVLDKSGRHARMSHNLAALCPAVPEVRDYMKKLVARFIQQWGFDGLRLEDVYTVPECHNPAHHHQSPQDSIQAMGAAFKEIFMEARALKPASSVEICPCGTPPNFAWLPFLDKAVAGNPGTPVQVRHRIKMYKALLGPQAAVLGNSVEPARAGGASGQEELNRDFASTVGVGGVPGARFLWSPSGDASRPRFLAPEREAGFQKWMKIYSELKLSQGDFQNLYVTGYDDPEGYVIQTNGKTYYAFFSPQPDKPWKGELDLRGLKRGRFRVFDYVEGKKLGTVASPRLRFAVQFTGYLLLEVSLEQ